MKYNCIIVHYDEIGLKGKNRYYFENILIDNIKKKINKKAVVNKIYGRILVQKINKKDQQYLKNIFGIANFSFAHKTSQDIKKMEESVLNLLAEEKFETFRITCIRTDKNFSMKSLQVNIKIGAAVAKKLNKKVKLQDPDINCVLEIVDNQVYIYTNKIPGLGGLPVGVSGKAVCLLSGGIDSPVSAWYGQKRGLETIFIHFHSYPHTTKASISKVKELATHLNLYSQSKLYLCPFIELQKKIYSNVSDKFRIIFYRRFMFRLAQEIAKKEQAKALITGEALGQVASQTIENIAVVEEAVDIPVLRPLIGFDKKEIIAKAKEIGTFDISIKPHDDCCTVFLPKNPATKANKYEINQIEKDMEFNELIEKTLNKCEILL